MKHMQQPHEPEDHWVLALGITVMLLIASVLVLSAVTMPQF